MAGVGGIKASANMWDLLDSNDPGDSETAAKLERLDVGEAKGKGPAGDEHKAVPSDEPESSSGVGSAKYDRNDKKARKERNKKQKKPPAAVANGEAGSSGIGGEERHKQQQGPTTTMSNKGEDMDDAGYSSGQSDDSEEEDEDGAAAAGGSYCWEWLRAMLHAVIVMVLTAIMVDVAVRALGIGGPPT